jgi:hypothetical protein
MRRFPSPWLNSGEFSYVRLAEAAIAVARLLDRPVEFPLDLGGWKVDAEVWPPRPTAAGAPPEPCQPFLPRKSQARNR